MRKIRFRALDKREKVMLYERDSCGYVKQHIHEVEVDNNESL